MDQALEQLKPEKTTTTNAVAFDFVNWMDSVKTLIPTIQADSITEFEKQLSNAATPQEKNQIHKNIAGVWERLMIPGPAAYFLKEVAQIENAQNKPNAQTWIDSGKQFFIANRLTERPELKQYFAKQSEDALGEAIKLEPENNVAKIALAKTYVDAQNQVMQGVMLLREVESTDPDNLEMNITLGRLSMISQQYEKAVKRMEKVLSLEPQNTEAMYYLGEAYLNLGDSEKAIALFNQCKDLVGNPAFKREITNYIDQIKNQ